MELDERLVDAASNILKIGSCKVSKSTRAGFTTSAVLASERAGKSIMVVSPTNRILNETVKTASGGQAISVPANSFCPILQEEVGSDKFLKSLPLPLPDCKKCVSFGLCLVTEILRVKNPQIINITYSKIQALMLSQSETAKEIRRKLRKVDIILLDEAHTISLPTAVRVKAFQEVEIPQGYKVLNKIQRSWIDLCIEYTDLISRLKTEGDAQHVGKHLSKLVSIKGTLGAKRLSAAWHELLELAKRREELEVSEVDILILRDVITIMAGAWASVVYVRENGGAEGSVYISANVGLLYRCLQDFLSPCQNADHIYSSATLMEPSPEFFENLSGKHLEDVVFPDVRNTNAAMSIYPDKWKLNSHNFNEKLDEMIDEAVEICHKHKNKHKNVYVLTPNTQKAAIIKKKLSEKLGASAPVVDYYRSDLTMGVAREERVCIAIGLAEVPSNAYDHLARGKNSEERWLHSQSLRLQSVQAATWQAWSRVKDPEGKVESKVYCIGIRAEQISGAITWGSSRKLELVEIKEHQLPNGPVKKPIFKVLTDEEINPPSVFAEARTSSHRARHTVSEYVESVDYDSEKMPILPINYNREKGQFLGNTNCCPSILEKLFVRRVDCYAQQTDRPSKGGRCGYFKKMEPLDEAVIEKHLIGEITIGVYQIGLDDMVQYICYDFDNHHGERSSQDVKADVQKMLAVLESYNIPFLLEASGSKDGYHIWIFLTPTKTYNAFKFARQVAAEAKVDCEVFPKQQGLTKDSKYGNLLKLPLGINRNTGKRSMFLDPATFQPYTEAFQIPGMVRLREVPEPIHEDIPYVGHTAEFRPCLKALLDARTQLEGSQGHNARLVIATEALNTGSSIEETIALFQHQEDFSIETTRQNVEYIHEKDYKRYSCSKIHEQLGELVCCESCSN